MVDLTCCASLVINFVSSGHDVFVKAQHSSELDPKLMQGLA